MTLVKQKIKETQNYLFQTRQALYKSSQQCHPTL